MNLTLLCGRGVINTTNGAQPLVPPINNRSNKNNIVNKLDRLLIGMLTGDLILF